MNETVARIGFGLLFISGVVAIFNPAYMPDADPPYDKLLHAGVFALATLFGMYSTRNFKLAMTIAALIIIAGLAIEIVQVAIPGRHADIPDAVANGLGVSLVAAFYYFYGGHRAADPMDAVMEEAIDVYKLEKRRGSPQSACLLVAADSYRKSYPGLPEHVVRQKIVQWLEAHSDPV